MYSVYMYFITVPLLIVGGFLLRSREVPAYAPPPPDPGEDELEHYKTQVKIMTDLINVRRETMEGGSGRREGGGWKWREGGRREATASSLIVNLFHCSFSLSPSSF